MKAYSLVIEPKLVEEVDKLIKKYGFYSSRSDFIRDSIRSRLLEIKQVLLEEGAARQGDSHADDDSPSEEMVDTVMREQQPEKFYGVH